LALALGDFGVLSSSPCRTRRLTRCSASGCDLCAKRGPQFFATIGDRFVRAGSGTGRRPVRHGPYGASTYEPAGGRHHVRTNDITRLRFVSFCAQTSVAKLCAGLATPHLPDRRSPIPHGSPNWRPAVSRVAWSGDRPQHSDADSPTHRSTLPQALA
jgi:hypothetical protein